jgi:predicted transcriptional regulator
MGDTKVQHKNFFIVSNKIFDFDLPANAIAVYCCLLMFADRENLSCFPSHRMICKKCNLSKNTVIKCLRKLEEIGLVQVKSRKRWNDSNYSNMYYLSDLSVVN